MENPLKNIFLSLKGTGAQVDENQPAILVNNFSKTFKNFVSVDNANFEVNRGSIHGFIGPNGSGKTTTIKSMIGAYLPTSGSILINGLKAGSEKANATIGYIPERASFPKHLNAIDYLVAMAKLSGIKSKIAKKKAIEILNFLGLEKQAKRRPTKFSSGMQKKILLAQSLLTDPSVLILDEPAANLDPKARNELFDQLIFLKEEGKTILISSHILAELERIIDDVTFLYYGNILYSGSVEKFNNLSKSLFVKTNNNEKLIEILKENKIKILNHSGLEIEIFLKKDSDDDKILNLISKNKLLLISYRKNNLNSSYEKLANKADEENLNKQVVSDSLKERIVKWMGKK